MTPQMAVVVVLGFLSILIALTALANALFGPERYDDE